MKTVCECYHLTNFALLFDTIGEEETENMALDLISDIVLVVSILSILITLLLIFKYER